MMIPHGVLLVQRDGIAVAADLGQVTIITGGNLPAIVGRDRLRGVQSDAVDLELAFRVHAQAFAGHADQPLDVIVLRGIAEAVVEPGDVVRAEDEGVAALRGHEVVGYPVDEQHVSRQDIEVQERLTADGLAARQQHRTGRGLLDPPLRHGLAEDRLPAVGVLAAQRQRGLGREIGAQQHPFETEVARHRDRLRVAADVHLVRIGRAAQQTGAEQAAVGGAHLGAQPDLEGTIRITPIIDRDADLAGSLGRDHIGRGPERHLAERLLAEAGDRIVGLAHLGRHPVVGRPHRIRRDLERLQEEAPDPAGHDRGHDDHVGVVRTGADRVDHAAVAAQHPVQAVHRRLHLDQLERLLLELGAQLGRPVQLLGQVGRRDHVAAVEVDLLRELQELLGDLAGLARLGGENREHGRGPPS